MPQTTLRLVQQLPAVAGTYVDYRPAAAVVPGWHRVDVRAYCHQHQFEWTEALTRWHDELMEVAQAATPWAWVLPGSRLHVWQESIRPFVFALGLLAYFREQASGEVSAVGCPAAVGDYVRELSGGSIQVIDEARSRRDPRAVLRRLLHGPIEVAAVLRKLRPAWRPPAPQAGLDLLVVSLGIAGSSIRERGDHYFGRELDATDLNIHWLYTVDSGSARSGVEAALRESGKAFSFDDRLVTWGDVLKILRQAVQIRGRLRAVARVIPAIRIGDATSRLFPARFFAGEFLQATGLGELIHHRAATRLLQTRSPRAVCYAYEEKGLDHALLMACAAAPIPPRTIAFAHAAYTPGHLYLRESHSDTSRPPRPTTIAASGDGFGAYLATSFGRPDVVASVGSPRWTAAGPGEGRRARAPMRVLFLTGFGYEIVRLAEWVEQFPDLFERCDVVIRPNWHSWRAEQQAAFERLRGVRTITVGHDRPLHEQIDAADVVLFVSTSAVAEAILRGRAAVYVELNDLWVIEPQQGQAAVDAVPRCATPNQLKETLRGIAAMSAEEFQRLVAAQRQVAERVYLPFNLRRFRELVMAEHPHEDAARTLVAKHATAS